MPFCGYVELIRDRWFQIRIAAGGGELKRVAVEARLEVIPAIGERRPRQRPRSGAAEQDIVGQVELEVQARQVNIVGIGRNYRLRAAAARKRLHIVIALLPSCAYSSQAL